MKKPLFFLFLIISGSNLFAQYSTDLNFENNHFGNANFWINTSPQNIWQIGKPHKILFDSAYSKPNCIITDTINFYPINCNSSFILSLHTDCCGNSWDGKPVLKFKHKFNTDSLHDGGFIEVSFNSGITWVNIISDSTVNYNHPSQNFPGGNQNFYSLSDTINGGIPAFTGKSNGWIESSCYFVSCGYGFPIDSIMVRFTFKSDAVNNSKEGWMIDNITFVNDICESIPEINLSDLNIYPNPSTGRLNISLNKQQSKTNTELSIFNMLGEKIYYNARFNLQASNEIDISAFQKGIYFIKMNDGAEVFEKKIVVE